MLEARIGALRGSSRWRSSINRSICLSVSVLRQLIRLRKYMAEANAQSSRYYQGGKNEIAPRGALAENNRCETRRYAYRPSDPLQLKLTSLDQPSIISLSACGIDWRINEPNKRSRLKARARGSRVCIMHRNAPRARARARGAAMNERRFRLRAAR